MRSSIAAALVALLPAVLARPNPVSFSPSRLTQGISAEGDFIPMIVGGTEVTPKFRYNFIVNLKINGGSPFCAGTLISPEWVLTAAHCSTLSYPVTSYRIGVHRHNLLLSSSEENGEDLEVSQIIVHPQYDAYRIDYDVALWKLKTATQTGTVVPNIDTLGFFSTPGTDSTALGWGATREGGYSSDVLLQVTVPIIENNFCNTQYYINQITPRMICAGVPQGQLDACQGDSGGPLITFTEEGEPAIVGIVSWGIGCARAGYPGVYTNVSSVFTWVRDASGLSL